MSKISEQLQKNLVPFRDTDAITDDERVKYINKTIEGTKSDIVTDSMNIKMYTEIVVPELIERRQDMLKAFEKKVKKKKGIKNRAEAKVELNNRELTSQTDIDTAKGDVDKWFRANVVRVKFLRLLKKEIEKIEVDELKRDLDK